jgi:hypothetical protein
MRQVDQLRSDWQHQEAAKATVKAKKAKTAKPEDDDFIVDDPPVDEDGNPTTSGLFDESEDESEHEHDKKGPFR